MLAVAATALPQVWMPNETLMSAQKDLLDFEFSFMRGQFTWNDQDGKLWVEGTSIATPACSIPRTARGHWSTPTP